MHEFVIVYMIDPIDIGTRFTMWPLHITLLPWFEAPGAETVRHELAQKLMDMPAFEVTVGERATLGHKRVPVRLINLSPELQTLHRALLAVVQDKSWKLQGRYTGEAFKPHVTQKSGRDISGTLHIKTLYIAESQAQGYREIVGKVDLPS